MSAAVVLAVEHVGVRFGGLVAIADLHFNVRAGEIISLIGPNGADKTTAFNVMTGFLKPTQGQVTFRGTKLAGLKPHQITRLGLARTFQRTSVFPNDTVLDNVLIGLHRQDGPVRAVRDKAAAVLDLVGLLDKAHAYPARLSGGQKQRVGIARALMMRPDVLLSDEPTSALDPELVGEVLAVMQDLAREGMTMIVVTHEMSFARDAATRVVFLDRGRVVEVAAPEVFFRTPETERARQFLLRYAAGQPKEAVP